MDKRFSRHPGETSDYLVKEDTATFVPLYEAVRSSLRGERVNPREAVAKSFAGVVEKPWWAKVVWSSVVFEGVTDDPEARALLLQHAPGIAALPRRVM